MQVDALLAQTGVIGIIGAQASVPIGRAQRTQHAGAQGAHGALLEPAPAAQPRQEHDLGSVGLREPPRQRVADGRRGEVLVLDIDVATGRSDRVQVEALDLLRRRHPAVLGLSACDRHLGVDDGGMHRLRPWVAAHATRRSYLLARGA